MYLFRDGGRNAVPHSTSGNYVEDIKKDILFQGLKNWGSVFPRNNNRTTILQSPPDRKTRITKIQSPGVTGVFLRDYYSYPIIKSGEALAQCDGIFVQIWGMVREVVHRDTEYLHKWTFL